MEALYAASAFATPLHLYVFESEETTPDAGSTAHLALYAASAFVIYKLITRNLLLASWPLNPPAARGSHFREAAATAAERRAASRSPSPHHRQTIMESSNADASAAPCAPPKLSTTRPPSRLQLNTGRPEQPHPPPTPKAPSQHHCTPAAATAPACDWTEGWGDFGLEHLSEPERKRKRAQRRKRRRCEEKEELVCYLDIHAQITAHTSSVRTVRGASTEARSSMLILYFRRRNLP